MTYSAPVLKVEVALEATPLDDFEAIATWTDLSARVRDFSMKRGRSDQLATFTTGTATITLDNEDRELDPLNPHGLVPLRPRTVTDGVTTNADATVTSASALFRAEDVGKAITGAGIPAGATIATYTSATSVELSTPATATATGVTVTIAGGRGLPFCPVRITCTYKGDTYPIMARGFLGPEGWPVSRAPHGTDSTVALNVVDPTGLFAWFGMPKSYWRAIVRLLAPDWWLPADIELPPLVTDGWIMTNHSGTGGGAVTSSANTRTVTDGVINTDTSLVSATAAFTSADVNRQVAGTGIDPGTTIASVTNATTVVLSAATTATASGVTVLIGTNVDTPIGYIMESLTALESGITGNANATTVSYFLDAVSWGQQPFVSLVSAESDLFPAGDVPDATFAIMFKASRYDDGSLAGSSESELVTIASGGNTHLRLYLDGLDGNSLRLGIYDGAGALLTTLTAPDPAPGGVTSYGANWDNSLPHGFVVRVEGGTKVTLYGDSGSVSEVVDVPTAAFAGDLTIGEVPGGSTAVNFDEFMFWRRALTDTECEQYAQAPGQASTWGRGQTIADRLVLYYDAAEWTTLASESDQWHPPPAALVTPDPDVTLIGVKEIGEWPKTLGEAIKQVAEGVGGDFYALRDGRVRVRSILAVDDATLADDYATPLAHLTDEQSPAGSPPPVRRGPVEFSGTRVDRVFNVAEVNYLLWSEDSDGILSTLSAVWREAAASPYMDRVRSATVATEQVAIPEALALGIVARYADPGIEVGAVSLHPTRERSEALMDFIVQDLELEVLVALTDTPPVGSPFVDTFNVQGMAWSWTGTDLVVTLNLAKS
jgi:hypothetical protein